MTSKQQYQEQWQVTHVRRYPASPVKKIYCRKVLVPVVKQSKREQILSMLLERSEPLA